MPGDLHIHTKLSDGSLLPHEIVKLAHREGMTYLSITNHDAITALEGVTPFAKQQGITMIDGVEISSIDPATDERVHILCYLPKVDSELRRMCSETTRNRSEAGLQMAAKVAMLYPITCDDVLELAKDCACIYKQHIMLALMNAGYSTEIYGQLYKKLFGYKTGSCLINCKSPSVHEVMKVAKESGGICVMAHPFTYDSIDLLNKFLEEGLLDGIEVWSSKSTKEQEDYLLDLAKKYNVIPTGGSDFHGANASRVSPIGAKPTPDESIEALFALQKIKQF